MKAYPTLTPPSPSLTLTLAPSSCLPLAVVLEALEWRLVERSLDLEGEAVVMSGIEKNLARAHLGLSSSCGVCQVRGAHGWGPKGHCTPVNIFLIKTLFLMETQIDSCQQILKRLMTSREFEPMGNLKTERLISGHSATDHRFWE